jgi:hypothetical protein
MNLSQEAVALNPELQETFASLTPVIQQAVRDATPVHEVERALWDWCLRLGFLALQQFFTTLGSGDVGEMLRLADGQQGQRLAKLHTRRYVSLTSL